MLYFNQCKFLLLYSSQTYPMRKYWKYCHHIVKKIWNIFKQFLFFYKQILNPFKTPWLFPKIGIRSWIDFIKKILQRMYTNLCCGKRHNGRFENGKWRILMKEKLSRFMAGRYGVDGYSRFLLWISVILLVLSMVFGNNWLLYILAVAVLIYSYSRIFSRNLQKRYAQNNSYYQYKQKVIGFFKRQAGYMRQRKTHHIYRCPGCQQKIRVPRGKGKISIHCPKCHIEFIKRS